MEQVVVITLVKPESHADRRKVKLMGEQREELWYPASTLWGPGEWRFTIAAAPPCAHRTRLRWFLAADRHWSCARAKIDVSFHLLQGECPGQARASSGQLAFDVTEISSVPRFQDHLGQLCCGLSSLPGIPQSPQQKWQVTEPCCLREWRVPGTARVSAVRQILLGV